MPKSQNVNGVEVTYDEYDDEDNHDDEEIDQSLLLDPEDMIDTSSCPTPTK
ncbi:hypothetical protein A2U01_0091839, partial [Trifolium medium]|nr:hypothetical protein [Trifolium medium]